MKKNKSDLLLRQAGKALRKAVDKVVEEHKLRGHPLIVWRNGKVVKIPAHRLGRI